MSSFFKPFLKTKGCFCIVLYLALACCNKSQKTDTQQAAMAPVRAVTENAYPPLNFTNQKGENLGLEYELTNKIADFLGRKVSWHLCGWDVMIQSIRQNMYDVGMDGIAPSPERRAQVDFSIPFLSIRQVMFVRHNETRFTSSQQFKTDTRLKIGAQPGTTNFYVATNLLGTNPDAPGARIVLFENFGASVRALLSGDVDMIISDEVSGQGYIKSTQGRIKALPETLAQEDIAFIFPKGSPLVAEFNTAIQAFQKDGSLERMIQYWFTQYADTASLGQ